MTSFNWADLQQAAADAGFSLIPKGDYFGEIVKAEAAVTSTGKDQIKVRFKVIEGPHAGASLFTQFVISPDNATALGFFFRHMAALGLGKDYFAAGPPLEAVAADLEGRQALLSVDIDTWNGSERNQVKNVKAMPVSDGVTSATPMPGNDVFAAPASPAPAPAAEPQDAPVPPPLPSF